MQHPWIDDHGDCGLGVLFIYSNVFEFEDVRFLFFFFFFKTPFLPRFEHGMICSTTATPVEQKLHKSDHMRSWARKRPCVIHCHRCALPLQKCLRKRVCDIVTRAPCVLSSETDAKLYMTSFARKRWQAYVLVPHSKVAARQEWPLRKRPMTVFPSEVGPTASLAPVHSE